MNKQKQIRLETAAERDAKQIMELMVVVEGDETARWYENGERPYIPGYDSEDMQKYHARDGRYYKILLDEALVGVILISTTGREHARIDRFYIHPAVQGQRIGTVVLELIESLYPQVKLWTLDTPQKSPRNHHFYEKNGYTVAAADEHERYYEKVVAESDEQLNSGEVTRGKDYSGHNFRECDLQEADFYSVNLHQASFSNVNMGSTTFQNINLTRTRITNTNWSNSVIGDSNLSGVEICHVSLAGAYLHDIHLKKGDQQQPLVIERCEMKNSTIANSDLRNLSITECHTEGMSIDGILVSDLLKAYHSKSSEE